MVRGVPNDPLLIVPAPVEEESAFDEETKEEAGGAKVYCHCEVRRLGSAA